MRGSGNDRGATSVEYTLLASFIAAVIVATVGLLGIHVVGLFSSVVLP